MPGAAAVRSASSRRDWIVLPLISIATLVVLIVLLKGAARLFYQAWGGTLPALILNDPHTGVRARPSTVAREKIAESAPVEYRFNSCGYRTDLPCGPKPPGVFRVVLIGSSLAEGMRVQQPDTFAARLPGLLSEKTGRKVEVYNEAMQWGTPAAFARRAPQILGAQPDLVLWTLTPWDVENVALVLPYIPGVQDELDQDAASPKPLEPTPSSLRERIAIAVHKYGSPVGLIEAAWDRALDPVEGSDGVFLLQHLLFLSPSQYLRHYLLQGESAGFLRRPMPPLWQKNVKVLGTDIGQVAAPLREHGVPLVITLLPHRAQAIMLATGDTPTGSDPYQLAAAVRAIAGKEGATYVDVLRDFRSVPHPERLYLPIDGHMTAAGQHVLADVLARELTSGAVPGLRPAPEQHADSREAGAH